MRKIVFLTGTRADFGKLKSLIEISINSGLFDVHIFATGMHMQKTYDLTVEEIIKAGYDNIFKFINHTHESTMDVTLAKTVEGFSNYVAETMPDLIVVHGDRLEALAGAIVGAFNNILVAHVEGGEISGTIDELIRHSVSKMSHIHLVANDSARRRLVQMGEELSSIYVIGSPDVDKMLSDDLPSLLDARRRYDIDFDEYGILLFHPVTTEIGALGGCCDHLLSALGSVDQNFIVVYPNNDVGSSAIIRAYDSLRSDPRFRVFPSIRFEYFLTLLKNAKFILGNSSSGIREAPYYGVPTINIGSRQNQRASACSIVNVPCDEKSIVDAVNGIHTCEKKVTHLFGEGNSDKLFLKCLIDEEFWKINKQKTFVERNEYV